mgnify:CR=1 FL=1
MEERKTVLSVEHLSVKFTQYERGFRQIELPAIRDLSLTVKEGEMVAVVGSSGSGKSLLAHAVLGILPYNAVTGGRIDYDGMELTGNKSPARQGDRSCPSECFLSGSAHEGGSICEERQKGFGNQKEMQGGSGTLWTWKGDGGTVSV